MRIEVVRVVKAELDEEEFETLMLALDDAASTIGDSRLRDKAGAMRVQFHDALTQPVQSEVQWS